MPAFYAPIVAYHRSTTGQLSQQELLALGTLAAGLGSAAGLVLYASGRVKLAAGFGVASAVVGAFTSAARVLRAEHI